MERGEAVSCLPGRAAEQHCLQRLPRSLGRRCRPRSLQARIGHPSEAMAVAPRRSRATTINATACMRSRHMRPESTCVQPVLQCPSDRRMSSCGALARLHPPLRASRAHRPLSLRQRAILRKLLKESMSAVCSSRRSCVDLGAVGLLRPASPSLFQEALHRRVVERCHAVNDVVLHAFVRKCFALASHQSLPVAMMACPAAP